MTREPFVAASDILREIAFIEEICSRMTLEEFKADAISYRAFAFAVLTISEASRHLPDEWLQRYPEVNWREIRGTGNRIRHEYFRLDDEVLWSIGTRDVLELKAVMRRMLESEKLPD
jgi:uncharacterized protein with HEPN domain